jgi:FHS family L-fucose permease-like MFS transporter
MPKSGAGRKTNPADSTRRFFFMSVLLFFTFGFATVLNDTLIPKLKSVFSLNFTEVMLTQFCFFGAYFLVSLPAGALLARIGYIRGIVVGLLIMAAACLLFTPAAMIGAYPGFLAALFVLACGITILQVAANSLITVIGDPKLAESRLTLAQAFNSLATTVGPLIGAALILANAVAIPDDIATLPPATLLVFRRSAMHATETFYGGFALILLALTVAFWSLKKSGEPPVAGNVPTSAGGSVWKRPRVSLGAVTIFAYVGAEVAIGSTLVNYLMSDDILGAPAATAGRLVSLYWGGAMVGRFIGSWVLTRVQGGSALFVCAMFAGALALVTAATHGKVAAAAALGIGLFNSIMFPTIFTLGVEGLGPLTPKGSGLLCLAIVGGAIVPLIAGAVADHMGLHMAFLVPVVCYIWIAAYGLMTRSGVLDRHYPTGVKAVGAK